MILLRSATAKYRHQPAHWFNLWLRWCVCNGKVIVTHLLTVHHCWLSSLANLNQRCALDASHATEIYGSWRPSHRVPFHVVARQRQNVLGLSWLNNVFTGIWILWDFTVIGGNMRDKRLLVPQLGYWAVNSEVGEPCSDLRSTTFKINISSIAQRISEPDPLYPKQ